MLSVTSYYYSFYQPRGCFYKLIRVNLNESQWRKGAEDCLGFLAEPKEEGRGGRGQRFSHYINFDCSITNLSNFQQIISRQMVISQLTDTKLYWPFIIERKSLKDLKQKSIVNFTIFRCMAVKATTMTTKTKERILWCLELLGLLSILELYYLKIFLNANNMP